MTITFQLDGFFLLLLLCDVLGTSFAAGSLLLFRFVEGKSGSSSRSLTKHHITSTQALRCI